MSRRQSWQKKFAVAIAGLLWSLRHQNSFWIHVPVAIAVIALAIGLRVELWRISAVVLATTLVLGAELLNTSFELLVRKLHPEQDDQIGLALDIASAAVLVTAIGAVIIGLLALGPPLWSAITAAS